MNTAAQTSGTDSGLATNRKKNRGYEAKVALKVALLVVGSDAAEIESIQENLEHRFNEFRRVRRTMVVNAEHRGEAECALCGKLHIADIFDVTFDGTEVPVGSDCIDNINFIEGNGDFADVKREFLWTTTSAKFLAGQLTAEEVRRFRITKAHRARQGLPV